MALKAPFPYFGGKAAVAPIVWSRLGDTVNFVEPFFGSGACLLSRPEHHLSRPRTETVNDKDGFVSNLWRAIQADPKTVARYADWPVLENDLHARHAWLVGQRESLVARLEGDPDFYDAKVAGWWCWGMSCWIGSGFASGVGPWHVVDGELVNVRQNDSTGVSRQLPYLRGDQGVSVKRPHLLSDKGIARQAPRLSGDQGVVRKMPEVVNDRGEPRDHSDGVVRQMPEMKSLRGDTAQRASDLIAYFEALQARLRRVRVCCGDWTRIMGPSVTFGNGLTGVFLDPPYSHDGRDSGLYATDEHTTHEQAREWAIANGDNPLLRIAYCGYEDGFAWPEGWTAYQWQANGGYGNQGDGRGKANRKREVIWFSRHCLTPQLDLFSWAEQQE